jgi:hypothetical protein
MTAHTINASIDKYIVCVQRPAETEHWHLMNLSRTDPHAVPSSFMHLMTIETSPDSWNRLVENGLNVLLGGAGKLSSAGDEV